MWGPRTALPTSMARLRGEVGPSRAPLGMGSLPDDHQGVLRGREVAPREHIEGINGVGQFYFQSEP